MRSISRRVAALETAEAVQAVPPSPVVLYNPGEPMPPAPPGVPVVFYIPENGR